MLELVKLSLRIECVAYDDELNSLIDACKLDLGLAGIIVDDKDKLIQRAVCEYCKANFGENKNAERHIKVYELIKTALALSTGYTEENKDV